MQTPLSIIAGALIIAASIAIVGRYSIGKVLTGSHGFTVHLMDNWTGEPFAISRFYED